MIEDPKLKDYLRLDYFFFKFRYKKNRIEGKNVFPPYIKQKDCSDHMYALNYSEYKAIIQTYFSIVVEELLKGKAFIFPRNLGMIELVKEKRKINRGNRVYRNLHTQGYVPRVAWFKYKHARFLRKSWYTFNLSRKKQWSKISKELFKDPSIIYLFSDSRKRYK